MQRLQFEYLKRQLKEKYKYFYVMKSINQYNLRGCNIVIIDGRDI
jgi:hypothetical protein